MELKILRKSTICVFNFCFCTYRSVGKAVQNTEELSEVAGKWLWNLKDMAWNSKLNNFTGSQAVFRLLMSDLQDPNFIFLESKRPISQTALVPLLILFSLGSKSQGVLCLCSSFTGLRNSSKSIAFCAVCVHFQVDAQLSLGAKWL